MDHLRFLVLQEFAVPLQAFDPNQAPPEEALFLNQPLHRVFRSSTRQTLDASVIFLTKSDDAMSHRIKRF